MPPQQAKCLPQIVWVRRFSHRIHRIHRNSCWGYSPTDCTDLHRLFGCVDSPTDFTEFTEQTGRGCSPTDFTDSHRWCVFGVLCVLRVPWDLLRPQWICENLCNLWEDFYLKGHTCFVGAVGTTAPPKKQRAIK